jgi:hypothetical protein
MAQSHKIQHNFDHRHSLVELNRPEVSASEGKDGHEEEGLERVRSPSIVEFGFHNYSLTTGDIESQKQDIHSTKPIIEDFSIEHRFRDSEEKRREEDRDNFDGSDINNDSNDYAGTETLFLLLAKEYEDGLHRLLHSRNHVLHLFHEVRKAYLNLNIHEIAPHAENQPESKARLQTEIAFVQRHQSEKEDEEFTNLYEFDVEEPGKKEDLVADKDDDSHEILYSSLKKQLQQHQLLPMEVGEEIVRLSLKNLGPRGAYFHRLSILVEYLSSFRIIFEENEEEINLSRNSHWLKDVLVHYCMMVIELIEFYVTNIFIYFKELFEVVSYAGYCVFYSVANRFRAKKEEETKYPLWVPLRKYIMERIQSYKIALAITICAILPVYNVFPSLIQGGFWATLVIALIRQENISSSFLMGYQRLEGTVIGAIFAFIMFQIFHCNVHKTNLYCIERFTVQVLVLIPWLFVCGLFREGEQHGYSATVAGFTPMVLLLNPKYLGLSAAWGRIEETFIGIVIYLLIDICIFPQRIYPLMKQSVLVSIEDSKEIFQDSVKAVEIIMKFENIEITPSVLPPKTEKGKPQEHEEAEKAIPKSADRSFPTAFSPESKHSSPESGKIRKRTGSSSQKPTTSEKEMEDKGYGGFVGSRLRANSQLPSHTITAVRQGSDSSLSPSSKKLQELLVVQQKEPKILHRNRSVGSNLDAGFDLAYIHAMDETEENRNKIQEIYLQCKESLDKAEVQLKSMKEELKKQAGYLKSIVYEPNLFFYNFPWSSYDNLYKKFGNVYRSSLALNNGSRALVIIICQMINKKENIVHQLNYLLYMIRHLFLITSKSETAMNSALEAFRK